MSTAASPSARPALLPKVPPASSELLNCVTTLRSLTELPSIAVQMRDHDSFIINHFPAFIICCLVLQCLTLACAVRVSLAVVG